jgi:hypothetical protein
VRGAAARADAEAHEALRLHRVEQVGMLALAVRTTGARIISLVSSGSASAASTICDTLCACSGDAVVGAVGRAGAGVEQAQVVVDLGDGADGRARIVAGGLLLDRDRRRQPFDQVDVGLFHQLQELAGVGGQRFHIAALALGVERVERQRRLAGAGQARDHHKLVARQVEVDVLQVVGTRPTDLDFFHIPVNVPCATPGAPETGAPACRDTRFPARRKRSVMRKAREANLLIYRTSVSGVARRQTGE